MTFSEITFHYLPFVKYNNCREVTAMFEKILNPADTRPFFSSPKRMVFYGLILPVLFCAGLILVDTDQRTAVLLIMLGWGLSVLTSGRYSKWLYMMFMPLIIYGYSCISWAAAAPDPAAGSGNYILWLGSAFLFIAALFPLYFEYKLFAFPAGLCAIALWLSPMIQMANIDITHYIELVFTGLFTAGAVLGLIGILLYISLIFRDGDFRHLIPKSLLALVLGILPIAASYATTWFIVPEWVPAALAGGIFLIIGFIMYRRDTNGAEGVQFSLLPLFLTGSLYLTGLASVDTSSLRIPFSYGELAMTKLAGSGILTKAGEVINVLLNSVISLIRPLVTYNFRDSGKVPITPDGTGILESRAFAAVFLMITVILFIGVNIARLIRKKRD